MAETDEAIELISICCDAYVCFWHKADIEFGRLMAPLADINSGV